MARLTATEQQRLGLVRPELMQQLLQLLDAANMQLGFTVAVPEHGGTRSTQEQRQLYADSIAQGGGVLAYPVGAPGTSRHEFGAAFDLHIVGGGSGDDGTGTNADYGALADVAQGLGLIAGYYFSNTDPYHFQLNEPLSESQRRWRGMGQLGIVQSFAIVAVVIGLATIVGRR